MSFLTNIITSFIEWIFQGTLFLGIPSYALAIVIFSIVLKMALLPLMLGQMRSMKKMRDIQPKIDAINEKYKANIQRRQEETVKLYQKEKINPMAGCLPLLVQMPILFALFAALRNFTPVMSEYYSLHLIPGVLWIDSLSDAGGMAMALLVAAGTFIQQWVSTVDKSNSMQRNMLIIMPLMMGFWGRTFPTALCLYWITFSIMTVLQQVGMNWYDDHLKKKESLEEEEKGEIIDVPKKKDYSQLNAAKKEAKKQKQLEQQQLQEQKAKEQKQLSSQNKKEKPPLHHNAKERKLVIKK